MIAVEQLSLPYLNSTTYNNILVANLKGIDDSEDLGVDGRIILE
jgi:hypothetical protein